MKIRILSVDGGGVRGIVPAVVLEYIENRIIEVTKNPAARLSDFLDFTAGTSTGSIISSMIIIPNDCGKPKYKMEDIVKAYFELADVVFKKDFWRNVKTLWGLFGPKYSNKYIENELLKKLDHWKMKDLLKPCAFTGYDIAKRRPNIYTNRDESRKYEDYFVKDIIRGSTSIPAYFEPAYFRDGIDINTIVDGGVFANNPALVAFIEAGKTPEILNKFKNVSPENTLLLSFGTSKYKPKEYTFNQTKRWGMAKWLTPILDILLQGMSEITQYEMEIIFKSYNAGNNFIRINPPIVLGNPSGKDSSAENMKHLHQDALNYITTNKTMLDNIVDQLIKDDIRSINLLS